MVYVRKAAKSHGIASRIEGVVAPNECVLLVEDLITDAGSKLSFINAICESGGRVKDVLVIFDRLQGGGEALQKRQIRLHAITDMNVALSVAEDSGLLPDEEVVSIRQYLADSRSWHEANGLAFND